MKLIGSERLILSLGMPRSGSTLLFNIIKNIVENNTNSSLSAWVGDFRERYKKSDVYVIKSHEFYKPMNKKNTLGFYTYRDLRDVLVSLQNIGKSVSFKSINTMIYQYKLAKNNNIVMIKYEDFIQSKELWVSKIAEKLSYQVDPNIILANLPVLKKIVNDEFRFVDPKTQMHKGHGTFVKKNEWKDRVDSKLIDKMYKKYDWWFIENKYEL